MNKRIALVVFVVACGGKKQDAAPAAPLDVAGVNALVPAALKDKVVFEQRAVVLEQGRHSTTYTLAAPKGWEQQSKMFGNLKGDSKAGFFSGFTIGSNCNGSCEPKDWDKESDKADFAPHAKEKIIKDVKTPGHRTMISESTEGTKLTTVTTAWWTEGDRKYHHCRGELDEAIKDAAPAFEKACASVAIDGED